MVALRKGSAGSPCRSRSGSITSIATSCAVVGRLAARRHGPRHARARGALAAAARRARRSGRADPRHAHASRPRRRCARRRPADGCAGPAGPRGLRPVRQRLGAGRDPERFARHWRRTGCRRRARGVARDSDARRRGALRAVPELLDAGEEVDGWDVEVLRGHADGHIVLLRDGVLIAGDTILARISPASGSTRTRAPIRSVTISRRSRASRRSRPGSRTPVTARSETRPGGRARSGSTTRAPRPHRGSRGDGRDAYEVSLDLFAADLGR